MLQILLIAALAVSSCQGLVCKTCSQGQFSTLVGGNNNCYAGNGAGVTDVTCTAAQTYCFSNFIIQDGLVLSAARGCADPTLDYDTTTTSNPTGPDCVTSSLATHVDHTSCNYPCTTDNCNTVTTSGLSRCGTNDCNRALSQGYCNFFTGNCVCNTGFSGTECQTAATAVTPAILFCVQCNSVTDSGCAAATTANACPNDVNSSAYCQTSRTLTIDAAGSIVRTVITRGCGNVQRTPDQCTFTSLLDSRFTNHHEYTCVSTCNTAGCNTGTPDGLITGTESKAMYCVVCSDPTGTGICNSFTSTTATSMTRELCPVGTTHCFMNSTYLIANREDLSYMDASPAYQLESVYRGCATAAVTKACTSTTITGTGLNRVVCQESCQTEGCNYRWPARPICTQCSTPPGTPPQYDSCLEHPPLATPCFAPYLDRCFHAAGSFHATRPVFASGYYKGAIRSCSWYDRGTGCSQISTGSTITGATTVRQCNVTCTTDNCNQGLPLLSGSVRLQGVSALLVPSILGFIYQYLY
uniref:G surface protein, allelic form 156 n=1 Tax=Ciona intestinalis TaxID=7719 RepID=H2XLY4_CIOIN|nr:G surface protein, allelic form 156 [Ciona intestinalis]|eukprot:XP_002129979.1 G surface protein, allelic form 156 [Ciona intestinalis]